jgi:iron complex transport system substrate-binding protein
MGGKKHLLRPLLLFAPIFILISHGFSFPLEAKDDQSKLLETLHLPRRIVSLIPTVTEELYLLGAGDSIVGVTVYCQRPPEAQTKEKVGTVIDVNIEKIVELRPNLVIASPLTDHKQIRKLRNLDIEVKIFPEARDFDGLCKNFVTLARLLGREQKAEEIIDKARSELGAIKNAIARFAKSRVFVQIGANPLFTAKRGSFINDLIECASGINIGRDAKTGIYSREEVIKRNPDIILIVTMGIVGEKEKEVWLRYKTVTAAKNRSIFTVDSYSVCSPTPLSFVETVKEFVRIFHVQQ